MFFDKINPSYDKDKKKPIFLVVHFIIRIEFYFFILCNDLILDALFIRT